MLLSISIILIGGLLLSSLCQKIHLPGLIGMLLFGIIIGPFALDIIDSSILDISSQIRRVALIIILLRAGLTLKLDDLKKIGRPALLMCFLPACFEIAGMILIAPRLFGVSLLDAAILGAVVGAVSPAVIVPKMIKLIEDGYSVEHGVPQLVLAGASVDDVFVIVMFSSFTSIAKGDEINLMTFVNVPISIASGAILGIIIGVILNVIIKKLNISKISSVIIILAISFMLSGVEDYVTRYVAFSSLIGVMLIGITLKRKNDDLAVASSKILNNIWKVAEIFLFVLVGACVNIEYAYKAGLKSIALIFIVLIFRVIGVVCCLIKTKLNNKEKLFCAISYLPKATVQAAIGGIPLAMGLSCGDLVLTVAVLAIIITAPLGAFLIDISYKKLLLK